MPNVRKLCKVPPARKKINVINIIHCMSLNFTLKGKTRTCILATMKYNTLTPSPPIIS